MITGYGIWMYCVGILSGIFITFYYLHYLSKYELKKKSSRSANKEKKE